MNDLHFAVRQLLKKPAFTVIATITLGLGIGANTAIFSVVNAVLLRPLPYPHSEELVLLRERLLGPSGFESGSVSYMNYLDWRAAQRSFTDLALVRIEGVNDPVVLLFTTGIIIVSALLVGIWPALRISNSISMANDLHDSGARGSDSAQRQRARSILVVAQVALA